MPSPIPALPMTPALARRVSGRPFLLFLDVDGTLSPIAPRPESALVSPETRRTLTELTALPDAVVAVTSGRAADDAARLVAVPGTWTIGNHGLEVAPPNQPPVPHDGARAFAGVIAAASQRCAELVRNLPGVVLEDKRWTLSVHYRLADALIVPDLMAHIAVIARDLGLRLTQGKEVIEVRPPVAVDKGTAAVELADRIGAFGFGASLFCAGDDRSDEDAFRALRSRHPRSVTVQVGDASAIRAAVATAAEFIVPDPEALRALLESIVELRRDLAADQIAGSERGSAVPD